jgi:hypothetical protein
MGGGRIEFWESGTKSKTNETFELAGRIADIGSQFFALKASNKTIFSGCHTISDFCLLYLRPCPMVRHENSLQDHPKGFMLTGV